MQIATLEQLPFIFQAALTLLAEARTGCPEAAAHPEALQDTAVSLRQDQLYLLDSGDIHLLFVRSLQLWRFSWIILSGNLILNMTTRNFS